MAQKVRTNIDLVEDLHVDPEVDDLYERMRSQFDFIAKTEQEMIERHNKQLKYLKDYRMSHKTNKKLSQT